MEFDYRVYHEKHFRTHQFEGDRCDMQWLTIAGRLQHDLGLEAPSNNPTQKQKHFDYGKLVAFRLSGPFTLDYALHPKEIIDYREKIIVKRVPYWMWKEWLEDLPETTEGKIFPRHATDEEKMKILVKTSAWKNHKDIPIIRHCFICKSLDHMQNDCPEKRICGMPKNLILPELENT